MATFRIKLALALLALCAAAWGQDQVFTSGVGGGASDAVLGKANLTTTGCVPFQNGTTGTVTCDGGNDIVSPSNVSPPGAPVLSGSGATGGMTSWGFKLIGCIIGSPCALFTDGSTEATTTTGLAMVNSMNPIVVTPQSCTGTKFQGFDVFLTTAPGTTGRLGSIPCGGTFAFTGQNPDSIAMPRPPGGNSVGAGYSIPFVATGNAWFGNFAGISDQYFNVNNLDTSLGALGSAIDTAGGQGTFAAITIVDSSVVTRSGQASTEYLTNGEATQGWVSLIDTHGNSINTALTGYAVPSALSTLMYLGEVTGGKGPSSLWIETMDFEGAVPAGYHVYANRPIGSALPLSTPFVSYYVESLGGVSANAYPFWADEQGVYRIKADNAFDAVYQAIPALYNPQFTKYTAGAANYERIVTQWESNVAVITTEKGGTGTLRDLQIGDAGVHVLVSDLKTTGAATGKKVVCVDTATGQLYASSTGTDCSN